MVGAFEACFEFVRLPLCDRDKVAKWTVLLCELRCREFCRVMSMVLFMVVHGAEVGWVERFGE